MKRIGLMAALVAVALSACAPVVDAVTGGPVTVSDRTKVDEQVGLTVTLAYTAASRAAALAINTGLVTDRATIARIGQLDARAYAAVQAVRTAYLAANGTGYLSALTQARQAVADLLAAVKGPSASNAKASHHVQLADAMLAAKGA
jgi:hypothetical protein